MTKRVLLDAGPWVGFLNRKEDRHAWAVAVFDEFTHFATCEAVLTEVCHRLACYGLPQGLALECVERGVISLEFAVEPRACLIRSTLRKYADQRLDFADACLLQMVEDEPRTKLVTYDRVFGRVCLLDRTRIECVFPPAA